MEGTDKMFCLPYNNIPENECKDVVYGRSVVYYRPQKYDLYCTGLTVCGNITKYPEEVITQTEDLTTAKLLVNITI